MRKERWKLIHYRAASHQLFDLDRAASHQLFDLEEDPHGFRNLFAGKADVAVELEG
jgi:hypothetical protein